MKLCKSCAHEIDDSATICKYCGTSVEIKNNVIIEDEFKEEHTYQNNAEKPEFMDNGLIRGPYRKWIAITLCILLGWLGGHKFYEGKYMMGIFYVLTFGICGVGVIIDLIGLLQKDKYYYVSRIPFVTL